MTTATCTLVLVDGPNVFNDVGRLLSKLSPATEKSVRQRYYRQWFDIDRLIGASLGTNLALDPWRDLGAVVVHSRKGLGAPESDYSIQGEEALTFWGRQGSNPSTATLLVDIPGARQGAEKGIDTSIVVYLFETLERWEAAVLFSNDTDFVPVVWSLRRRGKRVYCSSHVDDASTPLVQACQHFVPWDAAFLVADALFFEAIQPGAQLDQILEGPLKNTQPLRIHVKKWGLQIECAKALSTDQVETAASMLQDGQLFAIPASSNGLMISVRDMKQLVQLQSIPATEWIMSGFLRHAQECKGAAWQSLR